jgi:hypothetical protein
MPMMNCAVVESFNNAKLADKSNEKMPTPEELMKHMAPRTRKASLGTSESMAQLHQMQQALHIAK